MCSGVFQAKFWCEKRRTSIFYSIWRERERKWLKIRVKYGLPPTLHPKNHIFQWKLVILFFDCESFKQKIWDIFLTKIIFSNRNNRIFIKKRRNFSFLIHKTYWRLCKSVRKWCENVQMCLCTLRSTYYE